MGTHGASCGGQQLLLLQEHLRLDAGLLEDEAQRPFGHVAGVVRDGGEPVRGRVMRDLVTAGGLAMEHEPEAFSRR